MKPKTVMWSRLIVYTALMFTLGLAGCQMQASGDEAFLWSTGLALPDGVTCTHARTFTVFLEGDTYYVRLQAETDITDFLDEHFQPTTWDGVLDEITPPNDWAGKKEMAFWKLDELGEPACYELDYTDETGTPFRSVLAYDRASGVIYFVGMQCYD
jgi:hypothetical protein